MEFKINIFLILFTLLSINQFNLIEAQDDIDNVVSYRLRNLSNLTTTTITETGTGTGTGQILQATRQVGGGGGAANTSKFALIFPNFIAARLNSEPTIDNGTQFSKGIIKNMTLWTRAAKYELLDLNINNDGSGKLNRINEFKFPVNVYQEKERYYFEGIRRKPKIPDFKTGNFNQKNHYFACSCTFNYKNQRYFIYLRDNRLSIGPYEHNSTNDAFYKAKLLGKFNAFKRWYQFNAIEAEHDQDKTLIIYVFDFIGRLMITQWEFYPETPSQIRIAYNLEGDQQQQQQQQLLQLPAQQKPINMIFRYKSGSEVKVLTLSSIINDKFDDDAKNLIPFGVEGNLNSEAIDLFKRNFDKKEKTNFVEAITNPFSMSMLSNSLNEKIPLCLVNGFWTQQSDDDNNNTIYCRHNNLDISQYLPKFEADKKIIIYAMEFYNLDNNSYYHLFYEIILSGGSEARLYKFAKFDNKQMILGQEFDKTVKIDITKDELAFNTSHPNDLVLVSQDKCQRLVAFYDYYHITVDPRQEFPLKYDPHRIGQVHQEFTFFINAVLVIGGDQFYFFTYLNTIVMATGKFKNDCPATLVEIEFSNFREQYSQEFLMIQLFNINNNNNNAKTEPLLLGYREAHNNYFLPFSDLPKQFQLINNKNDSSLLVIVVGFIIGGLILAGLLYIFCLRNSDNELATNPNLIKRKSRRNKTSPIDAESGLNALTVRSAASSIQSGPTPFKQMELQQQQQQAGSQQTSKASSPASGASQSTTKSLAAHKSKSPASIQSKHSHGPTSIKSTKSKSPISSPKSLKSVHKTAKSAASPLKSTKSGKKHHLNNSPNNSKLNQNSPKQKTPNTSPTDKRV